MDIRQQGEREVSQAIRLKQVKAQIDDEMRPLAQRQLVCLFVCVYVYVPTGVALSPGVQCHVWDAISSGYLLIGAHKSDRLADRLHCGANVHRQLMVSVTVMRIHADAVIKCRLGN